MGGVVRPNNNCDCGCRGNGTQLRRRVAVVTGDDPKVVGYRR